MGAALAIMAAVFEGMVLLLALTFVGVSVWLLEFAGNAVKGFPFIGGNLRGMLLGLEVGIINLGRSVERAMLALLLAGASLIHQAVLELAQVVANPLAGLIATLRGNVTLLTSVLSLVAGPAIEQQVPAAFRRLNDAFQQLPKEAEWVRRSPLSRLLRFLTDFWAVASRLGAFVRFVAIPVLGLILMLELVLDMISPFLLLPGKVADLQKIANNLIADGQRQAALTRQLFTLWNQSSQQLAMLQADLVQERAARVAAATQQQQALQAATAAQTARSGQISTQLAPLLILATLAQLGAAGLGTLKKTANCDPCARLDDLQPDFEERISALEAFGE